MLGSYLNDFSSLGDSFLAKIWFSLSYNVLYLFPQTLSVFISLLAMKIKNTRWLFRIGPSASVFFTFVLIVMLKAINFFPKTTDGKSLYINMLIILAMNIIFTIIVTLNIFSKMKDVFKITDPNKENEKHTT